MPHGIPLLHAAWDYSGTARELILAAKERADGAAARVLLEGACARLAAQMGPACWVPAPASRPRWGGSLARAFADELARRTGGAVHPCLQRVRWRPPQATLDGPTRRANAAGCMRAWVLRRAAFRRAVRARGLWLVDDVATTGATLEECVRALRAIGCAPAGAVVLARVA